MTNALDIEGYYHAHLPKAQALSAANVATMRLDPDLAIVNIETAMQIVTEHELDIAEHLPKVDVARLKQLPEIALATKYAALRVEQEAPADSPMADNLSEARSLRAKMMSAAKALAENELVPAAEVAAIAAGSGVRDRAEDCVALAALFRTHASAIAGKHMITTEMVDRAAEVGSWLVAHLRPTDAPRPLATGPTAAVDIRNRFVSLLIDGHQKLQIVAHYFHPLDWEERVPALGSRRASRKKSEPVGT